MTDVDTKGSSEHKESQYTTVLMQTPNNYRITQA